MSKFSNAASFDDARSFLRAQGADLSCVRALVDARGRVLAHARIGGMIHL